MGSDSNHSALTRFLSRLTLRSMLSDEEQDAVLSLRGRSQVLGANHDIIRPGDHTEEATLVAHGITARFDAMRNGDRQITSFYIRGDMCDLHSVMAPVAGWGLMAVSSTTILRIPHSELEQLARNYPALAFAFWRDTTVDASILSKWVGNLGRRNAKSRVAHVLCEMGIRSEAVGLGTKECFTLDASQNLLADAVGLTAVHVNRTLQDLRKRGFISNIGRTISVPDWARLRTVAEFDPAYLLLPN